MDGSRLSSIGSALADPNRAAMLSALQSGRAHSAGELARWCGIAPSTASKHLARLVDAGLVTIEPAGRQRYFRIASVEIAALLETIDTIDLPETNAPKRPEAGSALAYARSCYDHLAGTLAVALYTSIRADGWLDDDIHRPQLTERGVDRFTELGLDVTAMHRGRRPMIRSCLDWTERRQHLAGALGASLLEHMLAWRWLRRAHDHRVLNLTAAGREAFIREFGVELGVVGVT